MKKKYIAYGCFLLSLLFALPVLADTAVRARVALGDVNYELGGDYVGAKSNYQQTTLGLTFAWDGGSYLDFATNNGSGKHDAWSKTSPDSFERSSYTLIWGLSGNDTNAYIGYTSGATTLKAKNKAWTEESFDTSGIVLGGGWIFPIREGEGGFLGVNFGGGFMYSDWTDNSGFQAESDLSVGYSLGLNYSYQISDSVGLGLEYKFQKYSYDFTTDSIYSYSNTVVEESFSILSMSITFSF